MSEFGNGVGVGIGIGVGVCAGTVGLGWLYARLNYHNFRQYLARNITVAIRQKVQSERTPEVRAVVDGMQLLTSGNLWSFVNEHVTLTMVDGFGNALKINPAHE